MIYTWYPRADSCSVCMEIILAHSHSYTTWSSRSYLRWTQIAILVLLAHATRSLRIERLRCVLTPGSCGSTWEMNNLDMGEQELDIKHLLDLLTLDDLNSTEHDGKTRLWQHSWQSASAIKPSQQYLISGHDPYPIHLLTLSSAPRSN